MRMSIQMKNTIMSIQEHISFDNSNAHYKHDSLNTINGVDVSVYP